MNCADCGKTIDPDYSADVEEDDGSETHLCAKCGVKRIGSIMGLDGGLLFGAMLGLGAMVTEDSKEQKKLMHEAGDVLSDFLHAEVMRRTDPSQRETLSETAAAELKRMKFAGPNKPRVCEHCGDNVDAELRMCCAKGYLEDGGKALDTWLRRGAITNDNREGKS